jgi:hypothetical protein
MQAASEIERDEEIEGTAGPIRGAWERPVVIVADLADTEARGGVGYDYSSEPDTFS